MPVFDTPLADSVARPLRAGVVWGVLVGSAGLVVALGVGGLGYAASWVGSQFGEVTPGWPEPAVAGTATIAAAVSLAAATWAACFAAADRPVVRTAVAAAVGIAVLLGGLATGAAASLPMAAVLAWSLGMPFERLSRLLARAAPGLLLAGVAWFASGESTIVAVVTVAVAYPIAAICVGVGDRAWRTFAWRRSPD